MQTSTNSNSLMGAGAGHLLPRTAVSTAVCLVLYGAPLALWAQEADTVTGQSSAGTLQEVVVTASYREQAAESVPYALAVISAGDLARTGVTDITSLSYQVPGLSAYDVGARMSQATSPVIRGINADSAPQGNRMTEQAPVGTYIGNSPVDGYFPLDDVQRIEVLKGPQGTLYGAGALGGAIRIIPNAPELGVFSGDLGGSLGEVTHAGKPASSASGVINLPLGSSIALRLSGKFDYDPGFIDAVGLLKRAGSALSGIPVLADPAQPLTSPGIYVDRDGWNAQETSTGRVSLLWKPIDGVTVEPAFTYGHAIGNGGPVVNSSYAGGAYPIDSRITLPAGGDYRDFSAIEQPWSRRSTLTTLDLSYDSGFATLSSTSSYYSTQGALVNDSTYTQIEYAFSFPYYSGNPTNPRFVSPIEYDDSSHAFTQELRLVSNTGSSKMIDYVVGLFYERQARNSTTSIAVPGSPEYSMAEGCAAPYAAGAGFPSCLVVAGPNDVSFQGVDSQSFQDKSVFGELTWHFAKNGQITFGGRHFQQDFTDLQSYSAYTFSSYVPPVPHEAPASKNTWKVNPSYEYAADQYVYAIWSQGFRRGGANAVPLTGPFQESPALLTYAPDSVNNYELGAKGRFAGGLRYTADVFDIEWDKPQIGGTTPAGNIAVWNASKARSRGAEADISGPLAPHLGFTVGGTYADAKLTESYSLAAGNGAGSVEPGLISGTAGSRLPGSPKASVAATLTYRCSLAPGYDLAVSVNDTYRSSIPFVILVPGTVAASSQSDVSQIMNFAASFVHRSWELGAYASNLADRRVLIIPISGAPGNLYSDSTINRPREFGLRVRYSF